MSKRVNLNAIKFDGLSPFDEIQISDSTTDTSFSAGNGTDRAFTLSLWVNLEEIEYDGVLKKHSGSLYSKRNRVTNQTELELLVGSGRLELNLYADPSQNGEGAFSEANRIKITQESGNFRFLHEENTWFHVCITYDGSKQLSGFRFYKNSHPVGNGDILEGGGQSTANNALNVPNQIFFGSATVTNYSGMMQTTTPTTLGGIYENDGRDTALAGKLADVCRFNRALSHNEVQEIYNGGKVKNMKEHSAYDDLVHWWKMGDDLDNQSTNGIIDYVGGYHGTVSGNAFIQTDLSLDSDTVPFVPPVSNFTPASFRQETSRRATRSATNLTGKVQEFIHGGESVTMPTVDPTQASDGFDSTNQKLLHTYWKAAAGAGVTHNLKAYGYSFASGKWSQLKDIHGNNVELSTVDDSVNSYRLFEISGVDKVYFKQTGDQLVSSDIFAAAVSSV